MFLLGPASIYPAHHAINPRVGRQAVRREDRRSRQEKSMALRKSSQRRSASAAAKATAAITTADIAGTYAYKFGGYTNLQVREWWLAGMGKFTIEAPKAGKSAQVTGKHASSIMTLASQAYNILTDL